ncbi:MULTISPECIES: hypothetical protein [unclassified Acidisoma]|nr:MULTISPECIES: hypothetical protein [unclassified Acidisoma]
MDTRPADAAVPTIITSPTSFSAKAEDPRLLLAATVKAWLLGLRRA